jgi:hypothetical protein
VLAILAIGALLVGVATPAPAPQPTPTNPFNLIPIPPPSTLPIIGTTRSRPVCTAIRRAVAPAVAAAMKNDATFGSLRKTIYDYVSRDTEEAKDLHLMQMDHTVDSMVKNVDALQDAINSSALDVPATAKPEDDKTLRDLRAGLDRILSMEKTQLNVMSGFVETERARRFATLNETEQNMRKATSTDMAQTQTGPSVTPAPISAFLPDSDMDDLFNPQRHAPVGLHSARLLDHDLGAIIATTNRYEDAASKVIIPAANSCK